MGNGYVKKLKKWSSKVTYAPEIWPRKFKYLGGIISGRRREKYRTQKFEFVTEVAVPFFRPLVAPHVGGARWCYHPSKNHFFYA